MPIQPIDLQTLFVKMRQVGKEQAVLKNSSIVQQDIQGSEIVKKNQHDDKSVHRSETPESGSEKVKDEQESNMHQKKKQNNSDDANKEEISKEILSDPDLGKNIDFTG